jgi:hypothetical protein
MKYEMGGTHFQENGAFMNFKRKKMRGIHQVAILDQLDSFQ